MLYQQFLFSLDVPVLPIAMSVNVAPSFMPLRPGILGTTVLRETFWLFFSPMYHYHIHVLDPMVQALETTSLSSSHLQIYVTLLI